MNRNAFNKRIHMNTITLDNGTYNAIAHYAKLNGISIADALKVSVRALLENFNADTKNAYYISPKVKALETGFKCPKGLSHDYKVEMSDALTEKYL